MRKNFVYWFPYIILRAYKEIFLAHLIRIPCYVRGVNLVYGLHDNKLKIKKAFTFCFKP